jgi:hypothetical protein
MLAEELHNIVSAFRSHVNVNDPDTVKRSCAASARFLSELSSELNFFRSGPTIKLCELSSAASDWL